MPLHDDLIAAAWALPAPLQPQKDGSLAMEALIAERKAFLSKRKLTDKGRLRVDDGARCVTFWELPVEKGSGVPGGDDTAPGFGFQKETYGVKGKERSGRVEEASSPCGKDFDCAWDYAAVRSAARGGRGRGLQPQRGAESQIRVTRGARTLDAARPSPPH